MGPLAAMLARQWWAGNPVNDGLFVLPGANGETLTGFVARRAGKGHEMRKYLTFRLICDVRIDVAACLRALAVVIYLLT